MGGGRIVRDRLWFYLTYRESYAENTIPGMFFNKNGGDPTKWLVDFDTSRPAFNDTRVRNYIGRVTWQVSPRNKISFMDSEQYSSANRTGGGSATRTPEAQGLNLYTPGHTRTLTWTLAVHQQDAARGRLGQLPGELRQRRAAHRRPAQSGVDFGPRTDRRRQRRHSPD